MLPDFLLWDYLKSKVYVDKLLEALYKANYPAETLQKVMKFAEKRAH